MTSEATSDNRGRGLERFISAFSSFTFASDFVLLNPVRADNNHELCDLLIVFDKFCVPIQVKAQGSAGLRDARWVQGKAKEAYVQTKGALRRMRLPNTKVKATNYYRESVLLNANEFIPVAGLAVVEYRGEPLDISAAKTELAAGTPPIHFFSMNDLLNVVRLNGTLPDFLRYLKERERWSSSLTSHIGAEFDYYAYDIFYSSDLTKINVGTIKGVGKRLSQDKLRQLNEIANDKGVSLITEAVERLHERAPDWESFVPQELRGSFEPLSERKGYRRMATILNSITFISRRAIGEHLIELRSQPQPSGKIGYFLWKHTFVQEWLLVFAVNSETDRGNRIRALNDLVVAASIKHSARSALGVSFPPSGSDEGLEVMMLDKFPFEDVILDEELKTRIEAITDFKTTELTLLR